MFAYSQVVQLADVILKQLKLGNSTIQVRILTAQKTHGGVSLPLNGWVLEVIFLARKSRLARRRPIFRYELASLSVSRGIERLANKGEKSMPFLTKRKPGNDTIQHAEKSAALR